MRIQVQRSAALVSAWAILLFSAPVNLVAQERILPAAELHTELQKALTARQSNLDTVNRVLATDAAQKLMKEAGLDAAKVTTALAQLSDSELARLADQARAADDDVAGGLIVGLLALIGLIVVIIVVVSLVS